MLQTPKYRWLRIAGKFCVGWVAGFVTTMLAVSAMVIVMAHLGIDPDSWSKTPTVILVTVISLAYLAFPVVVGVVWTLDEVQSQFKIYNDARSLCQHCGYKLTGIRTATDRCPECGERFKKI